MLVYILFVIGFVILIKGADALVAGASSLAKRLNISNLAIGLTVVAFGTSAPELIVNVIASVQGNTDIAIGNIIGSNIANILLILGISSIIYPLAVKKNTVWKEIPLSLLAALLLGILANDVLLDNAPYSALTRIDGLVLIAFFIIFLYYTFGIAKVENGDTEDDIEQAGTVKAVALIVLGLTGLAIGGKWIVDGAVHIASSLGVSQAFIGLSIVAIGTSLPELATSAVAALKKNTDIAIGNVVGSNIFNIFWVLGLSATIKPLRFEPASNTDIGMVILASFLLFGLLFLGKRHKLEKTEGVIFVLTYIAYIVFLVVRG
ncbi:MAG: sodium:proton exchanger [Candidatus Aquicultor primus]|uniref:Sodium:proton exchanger n=1 Tax=Candidatus Aquicultor primus TaxID=1797195 RepID=A0A1F2URR0_9ACTN|nr:MAG: sodium:proton exchanger [Candidatus Aquicultor primus]HCH00199.1 sodium:proton exchanger [Actinomycetota bacterium]